MFRLDYKYTSFKAKVGVSKETISNQKCNDERGAVKFQVLGDGIPLMINEQNWTTKEDTQSATNIQIYVGNVAILELKAEHQSNVPTCAFSVWAEAAVFAKGNSYIVCK